MQNNINMQNNVNNVFSGECAVLNYLNPDNNPDIPMVELPASLNPYRDQGVRIYAKLMHTLPLLNIKSIPAYNMLIEANDQGLLKNKHTMIENSSGNTVMSLSVIGKLLGIPNTKAYVSHEVTEGKLKLLQLFGVAPIVNTEPICPDPSDITSGIYKSKEIGMREGWYNPGQYDNPENPISHEKWTGKQIWNQTNGEISVFCASLGTTGTMVGAGGFLKKQKSNIMNVGVVRSPNNPVPGPRTENLLRQIAFDWKGVVDSVQQVGTIDSYKYSIELIRNGIIAGPSSGFNLKGLIKFFDDLSLNNRLDELRNQNGEIVAVFITCDTPLPYLDEYFKYLDDSNFPVIENKELLINAFQAVSDQADVNLLLNVDVPEKSPQETYDEVFQDNAQEVWDQINNSKNVAIKDNNIVVDTRKQSDFDNFHVPTAINMQLEYVEENLDVIAKQYNDYNIYVICYRGNSSQKVTAILRNIGLQACSVKGGMIGWSELNLPRIKPEICQLSRAPM